MANNEIIATGRRKNSIAVVKLVKGKGRIFVNGKTLQAYIGNRPAVEMMIYRPLVLTENQDKYDVKVKAVGGGIVGQSGAIRHGISRALLKSNEEYKSVLKSEGLLTRDARVKERKKYGRKRARKRFQFSKRQSVCSPNLAVSGNELQSNSCSAGRQTEDGTLRDRRCEWNDSETSEAIFDCTGGRNVNILKYLYTKNRGIYSSVFYCPFTYTKRK